MAYSRFRCWTAAQVWQRVLAALQREADLCGEIDWGKHYVDGSVVRAHVSAAGALGGQHHEALGRSEGGFTTKIHVRAEGGGKPMVFVLSGGERHEAAFLSALLDMGAVRRRGRGRPKSRPAAIIGDKGYSFPSLRERIARRGIRPIIPSRSNQRRSRGFDPGLCRERNRVERLIGQLRRHRRVATREEKRAAH